MPRLSLVFASPVSDRILRPPVRPDDIPPAEAAASHHDGAFIASAEARGGVAIEVDVAEIQDALLGVPTRLT
jgi:hypothetical protein